MSNLDNCCITDYWSCCESSISTNKFYAFSAQTEEHFEKIEQEIADIEISGITYSAGTNIDITDHVISVTGIDTSNFASKEDLNELSGQTDNIKDDLEELSGKVDDKQDLLVSGVNIKTINNTSLLGEGNIDIQGGGTVDPNLDDDSPNAVANSAITNAINAISGDVITINNDITAISATIDSISAVTEQDLEEALATKQDKLTAGSFIDIDNSNTISVKAVVLSRAQWEALTVKDNSVIYLIKE